MALMKESVDSGSTGGFSVFLQKIGKSGGSDSEVSAAIRLGGKRLRGAARFYDAVGRLGRGFGRKRGQEIGGLGRPPEAEVDFAKRLISDRLADSRCPPKR